MNETIPPMTDPLGRYWEQPARERILLDETHAVMTARTFKSLREYSSSIPTGCYPGKMWRRHDGVFDRTCKPADRRWLLCWYGSIPDKPDVCSVNAREIILL